MDKDVFAKEQAHLTKTYNKLLEIREGLLNQISELKGEKVCKNCGTINTQDSDFCKKCGTSFNSED